MSKTKKIIGIGLGLSLGLIALLVAAGATLAFTQAPDQPAPAAANEPFQARLRRDQALAQALGISLETLRVARQEACEVALEQMVAEGLISEERAQLLHARADLLATLDHDEFIAQALGISLEKLQAAREEGQSPRQLARELGLDPADIRQNLDDARAAAIQAAVANDLITPEQADLLAQNPRPFRPDRLTPGQRANRAYQERGFHRAKEIFDTALAEALNISVSELDSGRQAAQAITVQQALEEGRISEERADRILARLALAQAVEPDDILALALGITVDELQAARDQGQTLAELARELGLDPESIRENMLTAREQLVDQALASGDISEEQAQLLHDVPGLGQRRSLRFRFPVRWLFPLPGG